mmetsp:Transcript_10098/g.12450  ORF Transcript_10098/g.12450 Transcript_10098/m.12450 type:complete len:257 (-) Transcript_10098:49-819(-)
MADCADVFGQIQKKEGIAYPVLVPNLQGYERAVKAGAKEVAIFASASETFSKKNINCTIEESLARFNDVFTAAKKDSVKIRGYVSCVVGCPYEGPVAPHKVAELSENLYNRGCYEISLGDTIGVGTPGSVSAMINETKKRVPVECLAGHFHDTYGQALSNILASLQMGIQVFDASVSGLGGCPYAKGATGNVATEEVVYMLHGMGIETGVTLEKLIETGKYISDVLARPLGSKVSAAMSPKIMNYQSTPCDNLFVH